MELENFGWNILTIGFLGTIFFTFLEGWGLWQQKKAIWDNRSGKSVSVAMFSYSAVLFAAVFVYGLSENKIALWFNGLLCFVQIPILIGLWKFKGFKKKERYLGIFLLSCLTTMIILPYKDWFFLLLSFGFLAAKITQPIEICREKSAGVVEIRLYIIYFVSSFFWMWYALATGDWVLKILCPIFFVILITTIILWAKYREP
jgi:uncharacterized protein with PQ loop repeat